MSKPLKNGQVIWEKNCSCSKCFRVSHAGGKTLESYKNRESSKNDL